MKRWIAAGLFLAALGLTPGCGGLENATNSWADTSCECQDKACADKQKQAFDALEQKFYDDIKKVRKADDRSAWDAIDGHYRRGAACLKKFGVRAG